MNPLHATIEEFAAEGFTHVECFCPRCRVIRLRPMSWLPRISMGLTLDQLARRLRCAECGGPLQSVKPWRQADEIGKIITLDNGLRPLDQSGIEIFTVLGLTDDQPHDFEQLRLEFVEAIEPLRLFLL